MIMMLLLLHVCKGKVLFSEYFLFFERILKVVQSKSLSA